MPNRLKDPVCGMPVQYESRLFASHKGQRFSFCSDYCLRSFLSDPEKYAGSVERQIQTVSDIARRIAYFSMEVGVDPRMCTYSGGLGVLAGDTLKSAADLKIPLVAVSLLNARGYLRQELDEWGNQRELPDPWDAARFCRKLPETVQVTIEGRAVTVGVWQYDVMGIAGYSVPLLLLDTDVEHNEPRHRELTSRLYGGDQRYRLAQETVLGIGGVRILRALGYTQVERFHMNEGHAALLALDLLRECESSVDDQLDFDGVRARCVFTTHTPVPAGHDRFSYDLVQSVLGEPLPLDVIRMLGGAECLDMTRLALNMSNYINGVAKRHGAVSSGMFPEYPIDSITNGVHSPTWTADSFESLYDRHIPGWLKDPASLRHAISIPRNEIWGAHVKAKEMLIEEIKQRTESAFNPEVLTIGFARRATQYKRANLVFSDLGQLIEIARTVGPLQFVFAGKAHPMDQGGKDVIRSVFAAARQLTDQIRIVYLPNYDMALGKLLTSGVDLWLNTPLPPQEASGTSGMKAAHNGVPSLSVMDGWWIEGHIEGVTGWSIGSGAAEGGEERESGSCDAQELYEKLRAVIVPLYYGDRDRWVDIMRQAIAFNASFFNTHRMVQQYAANAYVAAGNMALHDAGAH